ncbi:MAG: glycine zipper domain-containing protein [Pseudomonadota bacterium]
MIRQIAVALLLTSSLAACASGTSSHSTANQPGPIELASAERGEVLAVRRVDLGSSDTLVDDGAGARFGGYAGLVIGSFIGEGSGRALGALIGLGTGALIGAVLENEIERESATEYLIRLTAGDRAGEEVVVLAEAPPTVAIGQSVRIVRRGGGFALVVPAPA